MTAPQLVKIGDGQYRLTGEIVFSVVATLADRPLQDNGGACHVALDTLERADSSVLALLLRWLRRERRRGVTLTFSGFSDQLLSLIDLYDLEPILLESQQEGGNAVETSKPL